MSKLNISIFGNKIFSEILSEVKLFYKYDFQYYDKLDLCVKDAQIKNQLVIFYVTEKNKNLLKNLNIENFPKIFIIETYKLKNIQIDALSEYITLPIKILNLENNFTSFIISKKILLPKIDIVELVIKLNFYEYYNKKKFTFIQRL